MTPTKKEKAIIRSNWPWLKLRFTKDGGVLAQQSRGGSWGVLLSPYYLLRELEFLRALHK